MIVRAPVRNRSHLCLLDGFIDFWEASSRLSEDREFALQILYHTNGDRSILCSGGPGRRTYVSFLLDVRPHKLVLETVDLFLLFNRLFGFLEPIFCGSGGTE